MWGDILMWLLLAFLWWLEMLEHLMGLLIIYFSPLKKCQLKSLSIFKNRLFVFRLFNYRSSRQILDVELLSYV